MQLRRCAVLYIEPREDLGIDWAALFSGTSALAANMRWIALAPHLAGECEIDAADLSLLGSIGQTKWQERAAIDARFGAAAVERLLELGLLIGDDQGGDNSDDSSDDDSDDNPYAHFHERDATLRSQHWRPMSALAHAYSRWEGMCVDSGMQFPTFEELVHNYGSPPLPVIERAAASEHDASLSAL